MSQRLFIGALVVATLFTCAGGQDNPTQVRDLRVLGMAVEPPEVLLPGCNFQVLRSILNAARDGGMADGGMGQGDGGVTAIDPRLLAAVAGQPLEFSALIADPTGQNRLLDYRLVACANRGDRTCSNEGDFVELERGTTQAGELHVSLQGEKTLGIQKLGDDAGTLLLMETLNQDTFKGLGGIRVPLMLELSAPDTGERVFAQKLMVYTCPIDAAVKANVTPVLPGLLWNGEEWPDSPAREVFGREEVLLSPIDFSGLEEAYVVPSLSLEPVNLQESWKMNWVTTSGTMSAYQTGGADLSGNAIRNFSRWVPDPSATRALDVHFYVIVRDGRGGSSWMQRTVHWTP